VGGIRRKNRRGKGGGTQGREPLRAMSAVVAPSNFLRLKYRPKPLHPELDENEAVYDTSHSIAKKVKPVLGDELAELRALRFRPAVMFPGHTRRGTQPNQLLPHRSRHSSRRSRQRRERRIRTLSSPVCKGRFAALPSSKNRR
jgi:hypothetical protein